MPVIHGYLTAMRFLRRRPSGPRWAHLAFVALGVTAAAWLHGRLTPHIGVWPGAAATLVAASVFYIGAETLLARLSARDGETEQDKTARAQPGRDENRQE